MFQFEYFLDVEAAVQEFDVNDHLIPVLLLLRPL